MKFNFNNKNWIHFIGIGGAGMSAIARLALRRGYKVTGSDIKYSSIIKDLQQQGAKINIGHDVSNIDTDIDQVVYSSCISQDNVEMLEAKKSCIPILHRSQFLAQLMNNKFSIAVCGSHGKTTTSALIYHILYNAGFNVSAAIGGSSHNSYEKIEDDTAYFVAEADESDGSFINLSPDYIVITNLDRDHFDFYNNFGNMLSYFNRFLINIKKQGCIFLNQNIDRYKHKLLKNVTGSVNIFGLEEAKSEINASNIKLLQNKISFTVDYRPCFENENFQIFLPGIHNLENGLAAIGVCTKLGVKFSKIKQGLLSFKGVRRRFEVKVDNSQYRLIEDYAHHPTEILATINTVKKSYNYNKIIVIFQPHRYTRTKLLARELAAALHSVDNLILTDIYPASELSIPGVSVENIYRYAQSNGHKNVAYLPLDDIPSYVLERIKPKDLVLVLGAGDVYKVSDNLKKELS